MSEEKENDSEFLERVQIYNYVDYEYRNVALEELVGRIAGGDFAAKEEFYKRVEPLLQFMAEHYSRLYLNYGIDKDELLHEFFNCTEHALYRYEGQKGDFINFYRACLTHVARWEYQRIARTSWYKAERTKSPISDVLDGDASLVDQTQPTSPSEVAVALDLKDAEAQVLECAEHIFTKPDFVIYYLYSSGYSRKEIASLTHLPIKDVYRRLTSIVRRLRRYLCKSKEK